MSKNDNELDTTIDEWREVMEDLTQSDPGLTIQELCEKFGTKRTTTQALVNRLVKKGKCKKGKARRSYSDGVTKHVSVYDIIKSKERKR